MRDTPGMPLISKPQIVTDEKGIKHFYMKRLESQRVVQHSRTLLRGWRANCDIKLLLYFSNPNLPDVGEIEDVCRYVVAYTGKKAPHQSRGTEFHQTLDSQVRSELLLFSDVIFKI